MKNEYQQIVWVVCLGYGNLSQTLIVFTVRFVIFSIMHSLILFSMLALKEQNHFLIGNSLELIWLGFVWHFPTFEMSSWQGCFTKRVWDLYLHLHHNPLHKMTSAMGLCLSYTFGFSTSQNLQASLLRRRSCQVVCWRLDSVGNLELLCQILRPTSCDPNLSIATSFVMSSVCRRSWQSSSCSYQIVLPSYVLYLIIS